MYICKINQDVKYVQFKGNPVGLINGNKYTNETLVGEYPEYFVEIKEDVVEEVVTQVEVKPEPIVLNEVLPEVKEEAEIVVEALPEVMELETKEDVVAEPVKEIKKRGPKPKILVDDSSDVKIEVE